MPLRHSQVQCMYHYIIPKSSVHAFTSFPSPMYVPLRHSQSSVYMPFHPSQSWMHVPLCHSRCSCSYSTKVHFIKNILTWPSVVNPVLPISMLYSFPDIFFINICVKDLCETPTLLQNYVFKCLKKMIHNEWVFEKWKQCEKMTNKTFSLCLCLAIFFSSQVTTNWHLKHPSRYYLWKPQQNNVVPFSLLNPQSSHV